MSPTATALIVIGNSRRTTSLEDPVAEYTRWSRNEKKHLIGDEIRLVERIPDRVGRNEVANRRARNPGHSRGPAPGIRKPKVATADSTPTAIDARLDPARTDRPDAPSTTSTATVSSVAARLTWAPRSSERRLSVRSSRAAAPAAAARGSPSVIARPMTPIATAKSARFTIAHGMHEEIADRAETDTVEGVADRAARDERRHHDRDRRNARPTRRRRRGTRRARAPHRGSAPAPNRP